MSQFLLDRYHIRPYLLHVNYGLREESDEDARWCQWYAEEYRFEIEILTADPSKRSGENVEAALAHAVVRDARPAPAPALARWGGREPRSAKGASSQGCPSALEMLRFSIGEDAGERGGGHDFSRR